MKLFSNFSCHHLITHTIIWRPGDTAQNLESPRLSRRVDSPVLLALWRTYKIMIINCLALVWPHYYVYYVQGVKIPPHCTKFAITMQMLNFLFHSMSFSTQEISHTYFHTCLKDHAGVDGQRDNLEVHFVLIGGNEFKRDDLMVIFLNFIVVVPTSLLLLCSRALEQGN